MFWQGGVWAGINVGSHAVGWAAASRVGGQAAGGAGFYKYSDNNCLVNFYERFVSHVKIVALFTSKEVCITNENNCLVHFYERCTSCLYRTAQISFKSENCPNPKFSQTQKLSKTEICPIAKFAQTCNLQISGLDKFWQFSSHSDWVKFGVRASSVIITA